MSDKVKFDGHIVAVSAVRQYGSGAELSWWNGHERKGAQERRRRMEQVVGGGPAAVTVFCVGSWEVGH